MVKLIIEKNNGQFIIGTVKETNDTAIILTEPYLVNAGQDGNLNLIPYFVAYPFYKENKEKEKAFDLRMIVDYGEAEDKFSEFYDKVVKETNKQASGLILPDQPKIIV